MKNHLLEHHQKLLEKYPDALIWFELSWYKDKKTATIEVVGSSADKTAVALGIPLTKSVSGYPICGFFKKDLEKNIKRVVKKGYKIAVVEL